MKRNVVSVCILMLVIALFFLLLFVNCIISYCKYDLDYSELLFEELTFIKYEKVYRGSDEIYFKEYEKPFKLNSIADKELDKTALEKMAENERMEVYFRKDSFRHFEYEICEISCDYGVLLSLSDYIKINQSNQAVGMCICPVIMLISIFFLLNYARILQIPASKNCRE